MDVLNVLYIINQEFFEAAYEIFNPRNNMHISKNDGKFDNATSHQRDTIINLCTFNRLGRKYQTEQELARKKALIAKRNRMIIENRLR